jgi:hypothetical protein
VDKTEKLKNKAAEPQQRGLWSNIKCNGKSNVKAVRLSALRVSRAFSQEDFWYSFLLEVESTSHRSAGRIG